MLSSAISKAHEAFKNGNYLVATRIYDEVYFCLMFVEVYRLIDCSDQVNGRMMHFSIVCCFPSWNGMCDQNYALCLLCRFGNVVT